MMGNPLVTVLMPNHNGGKYLAEAIQSVLNQTFEDFELLIVEDASTDNSREVIASFKDPRIRVIPFENNEHICFALNTGLSEAGGKYIARLDSDDRWYPDKLRRQVEYLEAHPECGASFTWVNVIDETGRTLTEKESIFPAIFRSPNRPRTQWVHDFYFQGSLLCHPSAVFPKAVIDELGPYRISLVQLQDYEMWIRIAKHYDLYVFEEPLMDYRHALKGGNVSELSVANKNRSYYETYNVISRFFDDMSDEEFIACFGDNLKKKGTTDHTELLCERALMLLDPGFWGHVGKLAGMNKLAELLDCEETGKVLKEQYCVSQMNFYELTTGGVLQMEDAPSVLDQFTRRQLGRSFMKKTVHKHPWLQKFVNWVRKK